jgi:cAMP-dependent protein kinase regulator
MDNKQRAIRQLALFRECTSAEIRWIARIADELDVPAGHTLGLEGAPAREFVVVIDGVACAQDGGGEVLLGPGAFWGETELLEDRPRSASITTRTDTRLLVFGVREFRAVVHRVAGVAERLLAAARSSDQDELRLRAVS